jgi:hypothetical protein
MSPTATLQPGQLGADVDPGVLLRNMGPGRRFVWYVRARSWVHDPQGRLDNWFEANYRRMSRTELDGVVVSLYDRGRNQDNSND